MAASFLEIAIAIAVVAATTVAWGVFNWVWLRPKKFEKHLKKQGFRGNLYRFLYGDSKENMSMLMATRSNPVLISHDVPSRTTPFLCDLVRNYGTYLATWSLSHDELFLVKFLRFYHLRSVFGLDYNFTLCFCYQQITLDFEFRCLQYTWLGSTYWVW